MKSKRTLAAIGAGCVIVGAGSLSVASAGSSGPTAAPDSVPQLPTSATVSADPVVSTPARVANNSKFVASKPTAVSSMQSSHFGVLRGKAPFAMPAQLKDRLASDGVWDRQFAPNLGLARLLTSPTQTTQIWLVPADRGLCLYEIHSDSDAGSTCKTDADAVAGGLSLVRTGLSGSITGIAPDGADHVVLHGTNGGTTSIPVTDNLYGSQDPSSVAEVTLP